MILNLCVGTIVISLTVLIHTFGLIAVTYAMARLVARFRMHGRRSRVVAMITVVMGSLAFWLIQRPGQEPVAISGAGRAAELSTTDWYRERNLAEVQR